MGLELVEFELMGYPRTLAERLLRAMVRCAPPERRAWVEAMLRELDFIGLDSAHGDWAALFWALGCTTAIFRECLRGWATWCVKWIAKQGASLFGLQSSKEENKMNSTGKKTLGVVAGIGIALAFGVIAFFLSRPIADMLQSIGIPKTMWSHIFSIMLPSEIIVVVAAIVLWRKQRAPIAVGMLLTAFLMAAHVVVHIVAR